MFTRSLHPDRFLQRLCGTEVFAEYCRRRSIPFETPSSSSRDEAARRWREAITGLSPAEQARVELELATVNEMATPSAIAHLLEATDELPPTDLVVGPGLSLWFFLHEQDLFREVFLHHEIEEVDCWRAARAAAGLTIEDLPGKAMFLGERLRKFFGLRGGAGRYCLVEAHRLSETCCFVGQVANRLHFLEAFDDKGKPTLHRLRPSLQVLFVYYADGTVLLKSHLRSRERVSELLHHFGQAVLMSPVTCEDTFDLDLLKRPFHPLPDAEDMEYVRVKALHLRYPERAGRRLIKLETLASDGPSAIESLLRSHVRGDLLAGLRVSHAELQVRLRIAGRSKNHLVRLWPNRCNLSQTPLGDRFRNCLHRWGLSRVR